MHCNRFIPRPLSRREMLLRCANGFGAVALASLLSNESSADSLNLKSPISNLKSGISNPHFTPRAKSVIFLYMDGGPSQIDTFDPKPRLDREHGKPIQMKVPPTQFDNVGTVLRCPWEFKQRGQSGIPVSELFPHVATCADDLCVIRSMTSMSSVHTNANFFLHSGNTQQGRPTMGAWVTYGLGSECQNLPGFVVLDSGMIPPGGLDMFNSGFLPATYQGSIFRRGGTPVADLARTEPTAAIQQSKLDLMRKLDRSILGRMHDDKIESAISNYELAFRMQSAVPELTDIANESAATRELYGLDEKKTEAFGHQCLLARRLVERGVRFVEVLCPNTGHDRWDQHSDLFKGHTDNAVAVDKPIAGLLKDLKSRGLLDSTLILWGGEFGRTPMAQGSNGRDHNPFGFTVWLAGGGVKPGTIYGATDDYGYYAIENKVEMHDLHATMLHLLGMDHKKLTYRFGGRDMRLTDVHGEVIRDIIA
jgi:hypothetical protein